MASHESVRHIGFTSLLSINAATHHVILLVVSEQGVEQFVLTLCLLLSWCPHPRSATILHCSLFPCRPLAVPTVYLGLTSECPESCPAMTGDELRIVSEHLGHRLLQEDRPQLVGGGLCKNSICLYVPP